MTLAAYAIIESERKPPRNPYNKMGRREGGRKSNFINTYTKPGLCLGSCTNPVIHVVQQTYLFQAGMTKYVSTYITGLVLKILVGQVTLGPLP